MFNYLLDCKHISPAHARGHSRHLSLAWLARVTVRVALRDLDSYLENIYGKILHVVAHSAAPAFECQTVTSRLQVQSRLTAVEHASSQVRCFSFPCEHVYAINVLNVAINWRVGRILVRSFLCN
jgi:hypothetical protein